MFATKSVEDAIGTTDEPGHRLRKSLGAGDLTVFGVGVIIGTGIFVLTGEVVAWIIGWDLILELALGVATVAVGWSGYVEDLLHQTLGVDLPAWIYSTDPSLTSPNLVAALVIGVPTAVLCVGTKTSARFNTVVVCIKLAVVAVVIVAGLFFVKVANWSPFIPATGSPGASSTPPAPSLWEDLGVPLGTFGLGGIFGSLAICTVLYVLVSLVVTGMVPYDQISVEAPLANAFRSVGADVLATLIGVGTVVGLLTVMMILMLGQNRVLFAMARDRLIPPWFSQVRDRTGVPVRITAITGAVVAAFTPISDLAEMVNIGTLFAFVLVSVGVVVLRRTRPDLPRAFRMPWVPVLPIVSAVAAVVLMGFLPGLSWIRLGLWMLVGLLVYLAYGYRRSRLAPGAQAGAPDRKHDPH